MSKQYNDQDEQQTPSGAGNGADSSPQVEAEATPSGGTSSRRSRRRGKGGGAAKAGESSGDKASPQSSSAKGGVSSGGKASPQPPSAKGGESSGGKASSQSSSAKADASAGSKADAASGGKSGAAAASGSAATSRGASQPASGKSGGSGGTAASGGNDGSGKGGSKAGAVALGLVILLGAGGAYFGWQVWQRLDAQQQSLAALPEQPATQGELDDLASRLESGQSERESAISDLRSEFSDYRGSVDDALDRVLEDLASEQQTDERDWLHAEAAYLLRLANQRLQLERDVEGAMALLRTADARLREADNPALLPIRRDIASELAELEAVPRVDRTGLYLALNAQQEQIAGLPLAQDIEEIAANSTIEEAPSGGWQQQLSRFGEELQELVTVRQHDEALEALITPEQESYLRQSVRLILEQAQLALLKEEQELFDASLDKALTLIDGYYDTDDEGVQSVMSRLEELQGRTIRPELPDISASQQALAEFIDRRFEAGGNGQGGAS
ncbi:Putative uroporphyrinogen-III C-methyltransferase [Halomonas sp. THAF12]|uniref:uroporphyrinogen-III C-methyltransferase n=1 Tax=Halomonas sp. THAF12 TaxID=2587849 RepID=UPI00126813C4|nr:uroporphyrinogen-III C-methyltransferase [Halomonas sp. THAF12]QFT86581.1 Putative uroporphyrinogen-III C-methyltransferase [Halomonas sp. THAF12]